MTLTKALIPLALIGLVLTACGGGQQRAPAPTTTEPVPVAEPTWVRFVHAIPDGPTVSGYVGEWEVAGNVAYKQWGNWLEIPSGEWDVTIRRGEAVELTDTYTFRPNQRYWVFAYGTMNPRGSEVPATFLIAPEESLETTAEDTWLRFANLVADGQAYGLAITTGGGFRLLFPNQPVGTISEYKLSPVYENTFEVVPSRDTSLPAVHSFDRNIQVGILYTIVATGRVNAGTLEVFHIAEGAAR